MSRPSRSHKLTTASFTYSYYLYTTYLTITIATKPCSSCTIRKPILDFFNGRRTVSTCFTCRLSIANSRKRARKPLGDIDPNKRRPLLPLLPKSPDRPAIRLSSRLNRPSSPLKRPRTPGLALEEQGLPKKRFRRRDENIIYKDFLLFSGFSPFTVLLLP